MRRRLESLTIPRLATNYIVLALGEFVAKIAGLIAFAYLARVLGPQEYGYLEFAIAVLFLCTLLVDSGLSAYAAREIAKNGDILASMAAHLVFWRLLLAGTSFLLLAGLAMVSGRPWPVQRLLLLYGLTLFVLPGMLQGIFQGVDQMQVVAIASVLRWMTFAAGVFLLVKEPTQIWVIPLVEVVALGVAVTFYLRAFTQRFGFTWPRLELSLAFALWRQAWPIGASEIIWALRVYFATVFLGMLVNGPALGWFGASHRVVISLHTFVWLYYFNLLPSLARVAASAPHTVDDLLHTSVKVIAWVAILVGAAGTVFARPLITLLYGPAYLPAAHLFQIMIWMIPLTLLHGHYRFSLIAHDHQRLEFFSSLGGAAVGIALNLLLARTYGGAGAAWALIGSELAIWGLSAYFMRRVIADLPIWPRLYRPLLAGGTLIGIWALIPTSNTWLAGSVVLLAYGIILLVAQPDLVSQVRALLARGK